MVIMMIMRLFRRCGFMLDNCIRNGFLFTSVSLHDVDYFLTYAFVIALPIHFKLVVGAFWFTSPAVATFLFFRIAHAFFAAMSGCWLCAGSCPVGVSSAAFRVAFRPA